MTHAKLDFFEEVLMREKTVTHYLKHHYEHTEPLPFRCCNLSK